MVHFFRKPFSLGTLPARTAFCWGCCYLGLSLQAMALAQVATEKTLAGIGSARVRDENLREVGDDYTFFSSPKCLTPERLWSFEAVWGYFLYFWSIKAHTLEGVWIVELFNADFARFLNWKFVPKKIKNKKNSRKTYPRFFDELHFGGVVTGPHIHNTDCRKRLQLLTTSWWKGSREGSPGAWPTQEIRTVHYLQLSSLGGVWEKIRETYKCQCLEFSVFKWTAGGMPQSFAESFAPPTATLLGAFRIQHIVVEVSKTLHLRRSSFKMAAPSVVICNVSVPNYASGPIGQGKCCGKQLHVG